MVRRAGKRSMRAVVSRTMVDTPAASMGRAASTKSSTKWRASSSTLSPLICHSLTGGGSERLTNLVRPAAGGGRRPGGGGGGGGAAGAGGPGGGGGRGGAGGRGGRRQAR